MKKIKLIKIIFTLLIIFGVTGCIVTNIHPTPYLEEEDSGIMFGAIDPTNIPAGGTWASVRAVIDANFDNVNGSLDSIEVTLIEYGDSITNYYADIQLRLLKSDTASMLSNYTRNGELNSALAAKVNVSDTAAMLSPYALTSELGDAGIAIGDVRDEIADSLNVLRPLYVAAADTAAMLNPYAKLTDLSEGGIGIGAVQEEIADSLNVLRAAVTVGNGTKAPYFDGSQDGGQILYFYGDNGFYTALQGGAPVANRSYRLPIAALPSAGTTSLLNIDQYGNMGFVAELSKVRVADSTGNAAGNYVTRKALNDSIAANLGGAVGITLNSGTITLNGSDGTADDITFYTNGDGSYDLPAGGGNLTIMSQVQGWINDSLDARIGGGVELSSVAVMKADSTGGAGHYASWFDMTAGLALKANIASAVFTGVVPRFGSPVSDTLATQAYARSFGGGGLSSGDVADMINDTIVARLNAAVAGIRLVDSTGNAPGNYVTYSRMVNYVEANAGSAEGITLNSGTLTLNGDAGTADDVTFYTNGDGSYDLPTGGGNLVIMSQAQGWISDTADVLREELLSEDVLRTLDTDTVPLFIFGAGSGFSADTALFNNNRLIGAFYNSGSDTLYVTELRGVLVEGTGTETIDVQVSWDVNMKDATPTNLNTSALTITSMTTGTADTSFNNNGIPPGYWVWGTISGASSNNKPTMLILTMTGFKRNRSY